ncbi:hypothetical protein ACH5RR_034141 [Cinchona calisaya]|uniref:Uncharacterized protein n=1 Tax=Cinchona calisaya TaxID=153742 RepID=A0ABD2YDM4_9GENT
MDKSLGRRGEKLKIEILAKFWTTRCQTKGCHYNTELPILWCQNAQDNEDLAKYFTLRCQNCQIDTTAPNSRDLLDVTPSLPYHDVKQGCWSSALHRGVKSEEEKSDTTVSN